MPQPQNLLIGVLGNAGSGKTFTWNQLFGHEVRTGKNTRRLYFNENEYVPVFLVSRAPGKRKVSISSILHDTKPQIVLCSLQYKASLVDTLRYFRQNNYAMYIQWLNPGYSDEHTKPLFYDLEMITQILSQTSYIAVRDGKKDAQQRADDILDFLYGWASRRGMIKIKKSLVSTQKVDQT